MSKLFLYSVIVSCGLSAQIVSDSIRTNPKRTESYVFHRTYKSPSKTLWIAVGHTVIPIASGIFLKNKEHQAVRSLGNMCLFYGAAFGPSAGNFYAHDGTRGFIGVGGRLVGFILVAQGAYGSSIDYLTTGKSNNDHAKTLMMAGTIVYFLSAAYNIYTAPTSAREYNSKFNLSASPNYDFNCQAVGLALKMNF